VEHELDVRERLEPSPEARFRLPDAFRDGLRDYRKSHQFGNATWPDLVATLAPREVWIINGTDPLGHELPASEISKEYSRALDAFRQAKAEESIHIRDRRFEEDVTTTYREFADGR